MELTAQGELGFAAVSRLRFAGGKLWWNGRELGVNAVALESEAIRTLLTVRPEAARRPCQAGIYRQEVKRVGNGTVQRSSALGCLEGDRFARLSAAAESLNRWAHRSSSGLPP